MSAGARPGGADEGSPTSAAAQDAESSFREKLREEEYGFLRYPHAWPRARSAGWRARGRARGKGWYVCPFCEAVFERRGKELPRFCSVPCMLAASRVRREYREDLIRRGFAEGADDSLLSEETGLTVGVVRQKRLAMGLVRPPSLAEQEDRDAGEKSAAAEAKVCADLLRHGYEVFRPACAEAEPDERSYQRSCDFVVLRPQSRRFHADRPRLVEVREVLLRQDCTPRVPPKPRTEEVYDTLALVLPDGSIFYLHDFEAFLQRRPRAERPVFPARSHLP